MFQYSPSTGGFYRLEIHGAAIPADAVEVSDELYERLIVGQSVGKKIVPDAGGYPTLEIPPPPTLQELALINSRAIQVEMDRRAQERGYDNILSACSYAAQPQGAPFQAEGAAFLAWRSLVWEDAYQVIARVRAGEIAMPTVEEAIAAIPPLVLP